MTMHPRHGVAHSGSVVVPPVGPLLQPVVEVLTDLAINDALDRVAVTYDPAYRPFNLYFALVPGAQEVTNADRQAIIDGSLGQLRAGGLVQAVNSAGDITDLVIDAGSAQAATLYRVAYTTDAPNSNVISGTFVTNALPASPIALNVVDIGFIPFNGQTTGSHAYDLAAFGSADRIQVAVGIDKFPLSVTLDGQPGQLVTDTSATNPVGGLFTAVYEFVLSGPGSAAAVIEITYDDVWQEMATIVTAVTGASAIGTPDADSDAFAAADILTVTPLADPSLIVVYALGWDEALDSLTFIDADLVAFDYALDAGEKGGAVASSVGSGTDPIDITIKQANDGTVGRYGSAALVFS